MITSQSAWIGFFSLNQKNQQHFCSNSQNERVPNLWKHPVIIQAFSYEIPKTEVMCNNRFMHSVKAV